MVQRKLEKMIDPEAASATSFDVVVIGAGMSGLAAAEEAHQRGLSVQIIEAGSTPGGLARSIAVDGAEADSIEAYYHHIFPQDRETRALITRLGLAERLEWRPASTAVMSGGQIYPFNSILDLLRFRPLPFFSRLRLGLGSAFSLLRSRRPRPGLRVGEVGPRWFGARGYAILWQPLLNGKFGTLAPEVSLDWLSSRIKQRALARKSGTGDRLGYLRGGLGVLIERYEQAIQQSGISIAYGVPVNSLAWDTNHWRIKFGDQTITGRAVISCLSGQILSQLVSLPEQYAADLAAIPYRGVSCLLLEFNRALGTDYWTNLIEPTKYNCLAVIEHTNFIPPERYGGQHLVYLTHYVEPNGPVWEASGEELLAGVESVLRTINPAFERSWVTKMHLTRDRYAQPVPLVGGHMPSLPVATGLPGLFHASLAHIYPDDRGVSLSLALGQRVSRVATAWLEKNKIL